MSGRQMVSVACLAIGVVVVAERSAMAQDASIDATQVIEAASAVTAAPLAAAVTPAEMAPLTAQPKAEFSPARRPAWFVPMHVLTVAVQALDAHSTLDVLKHRGVEASPLQQEMTANKFAFLAVKAGVAAAVVYATQKLSKRHRVGAVLTAAAVNSAYLTAATRNYRSARMMESRLGRR